MAVQLLCENPTYDTYGGVQCDNWIEQPVSQLESPVTLQDHVELSWSIVLVILVGWAYGMMRRTL